MHILGISAYHGDSAAAIIKDGKVVAAVEEERLRRIKHWAGFPVQSVEKSLSMAGITLKDVDYIAINRNPNAQIFRKVGFVIKNQAPWSFIRDRLSNRKRLLGIDESLAKHFGGEVKENSKRIKRVEHHLAHAASAFYAGPFDHAAILTVDAFGDWTSSLLADATPKGIREINRVFFPHSLGVLYSAVTQFLGFPNYGDEYKVMGLAPYGEPSYCKKMTELVSLHSDGTFKLNLSYFLHHEGKVERSWEEGAPDTGTLYSQTLEELLGPRREPNSELTQVHKDIAASLQKLYEDILFDQLKILHQQTGKKALCIAGGCAMNSVANGKILANTPFEEVFIPPQPGDAGGCIGAAAYVWNQQTGKMLQSLPSQAYVGPRFEEKEIQEVLDREVNGNKEFVVEKTRNEDALCQSVAEDICEGKVVGWFQGRMEWGARALGNRSIVCDPRRSDMKEILNRKIKRRESFRPFAPSILREAVPEYFETDYEAPYMSMVFKVQAHKRKEIPAVTHVDGSGRLQSVKQEENPLYYKLIHRFGQLTGVPVVLNTSFNENEPIVCQPKEALDCFLRTKMDTLVLGNTVVRRRSVANIAAKSPSVDSSI
ncbi:carbamoyltransferase [Planctomycetota bacterium]